jgi:hypothetical protein
LVRDRAPTTTFFFAATKLLWLMMRAKRYIIGSLVM